VVSAGQLSDDVPTGQQAPAMVDREMQTISMGPLSTVYESGSDGQVTGEVKKEKEVITYSKGVQALNGAHRSRGRLVEVTQSATRAQHGHQRTSE
jgi:hypothetical protein